MAQAVRDGRLFSGIDCGEHGRVNPAAAVEHDFCVGQLLRALPELGVARVEKFQIHFLGNLGAGLHTEIIVEMNDVDVWANC